MASDRPRLRDLARGIVNATNPSIPPTPITTARNTPEKQRTAQQKKLLKEHPSVNVTASSLYLYDKKAADRSWTSLIEFLAECFA